MSDIQKIKTMIGEAAIYVPFNCEAIRIDCCEEDVFHGTGEERGEQYQIGYDEVDLDTALIYKLVLMNDKEAS
jgi:hypothetical protein